MTDHLIDSGEMVARSEWNWLPYSLSCAILRGNKATPVGAGNAIRGLSHHEGDAIVTTSTYYTHCTVQLHSPMIGGVR